MELGAFLKLLDLGFEADLKERTYTIRLGSIRIEGLSFWKMKALRSNQPVIESLLSNHFITRRVMWEDFARENIDYCITSLRELEKMCVTQAQEFGATRKPEDQTYSSVLQAWANECNKAAKLLKWAVEDESDPINTGMARASEYIPDALCDFRIATYRFVEMFIDLLPDTSPVKDQAVEKLRQGKNILVKFYNVSTSDLTPPEVDF